MAVTVNGGAPSAGQKAEFQSVFEVAAASHAHAISDTTGLQTALDAKAPLASPALTGTPTAPTAAGGTNTTQIATTEFVTAAVAAGSGATNLSYTAATRVIASDTGTDATLPLVSSTDAGLAPASGGGTANYLRADGTWAAPAGSGTVTSVAATVPAGLTVSGSPITSTGTLAVALDTGYVIPTQAALDAKLSSDLATEITATKATPVGADQIILLDSADSDLPKLATISSLPTSSGTVTSVAASVPAGLTISGSPVTTTGTLAIALDTGYVIPTQAAIDAKAAGAASSTDNALARFDSTTGKIIQNSGVVVSDNNEISGYRGHLNAQTGTTYTLDATDTGKVVECTNAAAITVTLPNSLPVGFCCTVTQGGAGAVTFSPASGANIRNRQAHDGLAGQWASASLYVRTNSGGTTAEYVLVGDTA